MARSNNVLNTGFCPKAERASADLFVSTLTFDPNSPEDCMLRPQPYKGSKNGKTELLAPPMSEFDMLQMTLEGGEKDSLEKIGGNGILLASLSGLLVRQLLDGEPPAEDLTPFSPDRFWRW